MIEAAPTLRPVAVYEEMLRPIAEYYINLANIALKYSRC